MDRQHVELGEPGGPSHPRWYQRVVTTTLLGVVVLALAVLLMPSLRDQLALTATRRPDPRIELWFSGPTEQAVREECRGGRAAVQVEFTLRSHLEAPAAVPFRVVLAPDSQPVRVRSGVVELAEDEVAVVRHRFSLGPGRPYSVRVTLPGHPERLYLRCGASLR